MTVRNHPRVAKPPPRTTGRVRSFASTLLAGSDGAGIRTFSRFSRSQACSDRNRLDMSAGFADPFSANPASLPFSGFSGAYGV